MPRVSKPKPNNRGSDSSSGNNTTRPSAIGYHWNLRSFAVHGEDDDNGGGNKKGKTDQSNLTTISEADTASTGSGSVVSGGVPARPAFEKTTSAADVFGNFAPTTSTLHPNNATRVAFVDGREVKFELLENVTKLPTTDREERLKRTIHIVNAPSSRFESKMKFWLMRRDMVSLSAIYLAAFVALNAVFAGFFYIGEDRCCDNPDLTFGNVFAFTVQTSTTIGYGGFVPQGPISNFLVVMISFLATLLSTVFAGLIFARFVRPEARLLFSNVMTYCNFNGLPCLQLRVGNVDGWENELACVEARLTYVYLVQYKDENDREQTFGQTEELKLLNDKSQVLPGVWTLRHVLDENSPLFGLNLMEYPGSSILEFRISITATQKSTQGMISEQTGYMKEDVMIGHGFDDQTTWDADSRTLCIHYDMMSKTHPQPVWYPARRFGIPP